MKRIRFTEEQIIDALKRVDNGLAVQDLCRDVGISEQTYYNWRRKYGGMDKTQIMELKQLRDQNKRLKRLVADQALDIQALKAINGKNW
jgi:putative transposase